MPRPLVSVVIPVYNGAKFLGAAVDSVLAQSYRPIELILVDDGSTDDSPRLIASYGSRVVAVSQKNQGVGHARNAGVLQARGEFVAFLDQDDWWASDKLERQVRVFLSDDSIGLVHTGVKHYYEVTATFGAPLNPNSRPDEIVGRCYDRLLLGNSIYNSSVMVRKSILDAAGKFDTEICGNTVQDYDLWLRCAEHSSFAYLPEELLVFRLHADQGTWNRRQMLTEELRLLERRTSHPALAHSVAMRTHLAKLWSELGVAHLDTFDHRQARKCFGRSLGAQWSARTGLLYAASCLPQWAITSLRTARATLRRPTGRSSGQQYNRGDKSK